MLAVSDMLYARYQEEDLYRRLLSQLRQYARSEIFRRTLSDEGFCRRVWSEHLDSTISRYDQVVRMSFALGSVVAGSPKSKAEVVALKNIVMKAHLDTWGFVPFSSFDLANA